MRRWLYFLLIILNVIILSACNNAGEENNSDKNEQSVTPVETVEVKQGDLTVDKSIYGTVAPAKQTPVMVQQPGEITTLKVENGDKVKKDDHLATIKTAMGSQSIYAPTDGKIAKLDVQENDIQSNEEPLLLIVDLEQLHVSFSVTPTMRDLFEKDQNISLEIDGKNFDGTVLPLDSLPNEQGQYSVIAKVDNEQEVLPGAVAQLIITDKKVKDTTLVPTAAILTENEESYVFIVKDGLAERVVVEIKETQSEETAVVADLEKGDQIIVNGQFTLSDGSEVEVVKEGKQS